MELKQIKQGQKFKPSMLMTVYSVTLAAILFITTYFNLGFSIPLTKWATIIVAGTVITMGLPELTIVYISRILKAGKDRKQILMSSVLLVSMFATIISSLLKLPFYNLLFIYVYSEIYTDMFTLLAFYVFVEAFKHMQLKSVQSGIFILGAVLTLLGNSPSTVAIFPFYRSINDWLWAIPIAASARAWTMTPVPLMLAMAVLTIVRYKQLRT